MNKNKELLPFYQKAKELLEYNPDTGVFTWRVSNSNRVKIGDIAGCLHKNSGYTLIRVGDKLLRAHRIAFFIVNNETPNVIDHINGDRSDNRISNLRSCTSQQNGFNSSKQINNTSGYRGVSKAGNKWRARIYIKNKETSLGHFDCPKEASRVYEEKARELHGEFYNDKI